MAAPPLFAQESAAEGLTFTTGDTTVRMHMVRRYYDFTKDIAGIRAAAEPGHQAHLLQFGQSVAASALLDEDGVRIGSLSISNIPTLEDTRRYVYNDPFTQGGIYKEITIEAVDLYKVDGAYNRAPAWFAPELQRRQRANGFDVPVKPTGQEPAPVMYLIQKTYTDRETVDAIIAEHQDAHHAHLRAHGRNVVSAAVKNEAGDSVRSLAYGAYESWDEVNRFVYEDPYTLAGMFDAITIEIVDLYKLDGYYERAPAWFYDEMTQPRTANAEAEENDDRIAVLVEHTGTYSRPVSTDSPLAQQFFDQGLRLDWGYYFPSAIASHREALRLEYHPMFDWGVAAAIAPNPNSRRFGAPDDPDGDGLKAITRAMANKARATELEQALIEAVHVRYDASAIPDRDARDQAYFAAIGELLRKYPDDPDLAALYADAFMSMNAWDYWDANGRARPGTEDAAKVLEDSMTRHPGHPGTNHLYIHLLEASPRPERALPAADRLAGLMPNAGHMVHMPGHIYLRVGQYDKAIATNERSVIADDIFDAAWGDRPLYRVGSANTSFKNHRGHSLSFVRFAAAMQGNYALAIDAARRGRPGWRQDVTIWHIHKMFEKWETLLAIDPARTENLSRDGMLAYVQGSAQANTGRIDEAERSLATVHAILADDALAAGPSAFNSQRSLLEVAAAGLEGEVKQARGDLDGAIAAFETAVEREQALSYMEPPSWPLPMRHYLGDALLQANRAAEAEQVFRDDLAWNMNNGRGLHGLWQSLVAQGKSREAAEVKARFDAAWQSADTQLAAARF